MPLSASDIAALSRLLDEVEDVPTDRREAWLAALPPAQRSLATHLRAALDATTALPSHLPHLTQEEPPEAQAGDLVGPWRLRREIGRGGMGAVWNAVRADGLYEREVALKLPRLSRGPALAERMAQERQIGAQLEHPHIARQYDAGLDADGRPYLVLELVRGRPLLDHAAELGRDDRLRLMLQACSAVAHAHRQGVVHRDIKPSNLMVDEQGELKLLDFGIARLLDAAGRARASDGRATHTPGYAAPEQVAGRPLTTACDIFSLGVVLHELLAGRRTRDADSLAALGRDAAVVVARATRDDPADRHATVEHLADDLRCLLALRPPRSDPGPRMHRLALLLRRRRVEVAATALVLAVVASGATAIWRQQVELRDESLRSAQAREYLFDVLETVEPNEGQAPEEVTGGQMLRSALVRARTAFRDQPALRGDVLVELGIMFRRFADPGLTLTLLREGESLLAIHAAHDDPGLARARGQLAQQRLEEDDGDLDGINRLATAAIEDCRHGEERCARAEAYARVALLQLAHRRGDVDGAVLQAKAAVAANIRAFGAADAETVVARLQLAITLRNGGRLAEAMQALGPARDAAASTTLSAGRRVEFELWDAVIVADTGRHTDAIAGLDRLLQLPAASRQRPTLLRLRSQSRHALGQWSAALADADSALVASQGPGWALARLWSRQAKARASARLGDSTGASAELDAIDAEFEALGLVASSVERLRAGRLAAEAALLAGDDSNAARTLAALQQLHRSGTGAPKAPLDYAQVLQLQATLARRAGDLLTAAAKLHEAAPWLQVVPPTHPWRRRQAVEVALAAADPRALAHAVATWIAELPADSGLRVLLQGLPGDESGRRYVVL